MYTTTSGSSSMPFRYQFIAIFVSDGGKWSVTNERRPLAYEIKSST